MGLPANEQGCGAGRWDPPGAGQKEKGAEAPSKTAGWFEASAPPSAPRDGLRRTDHEIRIRSAARLSRGGRDEAAARLARIGGEPALGQGHDAGALIVEHIG